MSSTTPPPSASAAISSPASHRFSSSVPWQVDWKNPTWAQYSTAQSPPESSSSNRKTIVGFSTAHVLANEIAKECPSIWKSSFEGNEDGNTDEHHFLLTITLLNPSGDGGTGVATELTLTLSHCETKETLLVRTLVWPETIRSATRQRINAQKRTVWTGLGELFLPWLKLDTVPESEEEEDSTRTLNSAPSDSGIVAATLCRQPLTQAAQREEALEVISSMLVGLGPSLGNLDEMSEDGRSKLTSTSSKNIKSTSSSSDLGQTETEESSFRTTEHPLCVACISSHGLICIYSVWELLLSEAPKREDSSQDSETSSSRRRDEERAMAEWLLGAELFQRLESAWLPLSQPKTTISLSILHETWNRQKRDSVYDGDEEAKPPVVVDTAIPDTDIQPPPRPSTNLLAWNPWIEPSTLPQRTVHNQATSIHVVGPTFPYVVVLGRGIPHFSPLVSSKSRQKKRQSLNKTKDSVQAGIAPSKAKPDKDWWKDSSQWSSASSTKKEDQSSNDQGDDWWATGGSSESAFTQEDGKKPAKKSPSPKSAATIDSDDDPSLHVGGFVTFCSMGSWAESKTLFLDFEPRSVTHVEHWHGMELLLCIGDDKVVAIRLDSTALPVVVGSDDELRAFLGKNDPNNSGHNLSNIPTIQVHRFQILPVEIHLPIVGDTGTKTNQRVLCAAGTTPPSLLQLYTEFDARSQEERGLLVMPTLSGVSQNGSIKTSTQEGGRVAQIPAQEGHGSKKSLLRSVWGCLGQGWSLIGTENTAYFLCWEGASSNRGVSFLQELPGSPSGKLSHRAVASVLPLPSAHPQSRALDASVRLPFSESYEEIRFDQQIEEGPESADVVAEAMQSISSIRMDGNMPIRVNPLPQEDPTEISQLSNQQKSERLLRHLSSWTQLEDTEVNRSLLARQTPVIATASSEDDSSMQLNVLNIRQVVIENGAASPFSQVLGWLSQKRDYFTAASIALDLLRDAETLYHLWKNADKIDEEDEQTKLRGLLDGIIPISIEGDQHAARSPEPATWTQLADMTVGCLVKGGLAMSKTLVRFLHTNRDYDPARASLMLVATITSAVSGHEESVALAMGSSTQTKIGSINDYSISDLLWPLRCLLEIGVARDYLKTALSLLNVACSDEIRRRPRQGDGMAFPLELTKAMVTMIVSCDSTGAMLLLDLPTEQTSQSYWESLDEETQHELALIEIRHKYPMLLQEEVREWTRGRLHQLLSSGINGSKWPISIEWLRELASACLFNAGCDLKDFVLDPTNMSMISVGSENSTLWADIEMDGEDGLYQHKLEIVETRNALEAAPGSGGLDLDLLIPSLLLLRSLQETWRKGDERLVPTQSLLDAACYLAGRPVSGAEEPRFGLDATALMKQCALSGNVRAGASLIGGKDGFVLNCCDIMMLELQVSIEDAEAFFLNDSLETSRILTEESSKFQPDRFELTDSHRQLLWLLDEHVLCVRTYGEFEAEQRARGRVDPVFAARSVFRGWLCLTFSCKRSGSEWMCRWLAGRLGFHKGTTSTHRLACAALVRALIWPSDGNEFNEESMSPDSLLGHVLEMDRHFLIQLAQCSCGLVEAVPPPIAEGVIGLTDATQDLSSSFASMRVARTV